MIRIPTLAICLLVSLQSLSQVPIDSLNSSTSLIITHGGKQLLGVAEIDRDRSIVKMVVDGQFHFLLFESIAEMKVYDELGAVKQSFKYYKDLNTTGQCKFLEQLLTGDIHYLQEKNDNLRIWTRSLHSPKRQVLRGNHYFWNDGNLQKVTSFKKQLFKLCKNAREQELLKEYISKRNLRFFDADHRIAAVNYLNAIRRTQG